MRRPEGERPGPRIDWLAFAVALVTTPLALGIGGAVLIFPPFAVVAAMPAYLVCGVPAAVVAAWLWHRERGEGNPAVFARAALLANLFSPVGYVVFDLVGDMLAGERVLVSSHLGTLVALSVPGVVLAPVMGLIFGLIYERVVRWRVRRAVRVELRRVP